MPPMRHMPVQTVRVCFAVFQKYWADLQQRRSGEPDTFQSAHEDALAPITKNYTELAAALQNGDSLTSAQQNLLHFAVDTTHKQLECFACCAPLQPPFLISATGHWTQDSRLTTEYLKQLISTYVYDQQTKKPFWQRLLGLRRLLSTTTPTPPIAEGEDMGKGRFWASRPRVNPSPDVADSANTAQHSTAGRPALKRQNAFKLNEEQSQALTQQLGLTSGSHSASGHDLLAATSAEDDGDADQAADPADRHSSSQVLGSSSNLGSVLAGAKALSQRQGSKGSGTEGRAVGDWPDPHQPFNATTAYANVTRCNTKRWLSVHAGGAPSIFVTPAALFCRLCFHLYAFQQCCQPISCTTPWKSLWCHLFLLTTATRGPALVWACNLSSWRIACP